MVHDITLIKTDNTLFFKKIKQKSDLLKKDLDTFDGFLIDIKGNEKETRRIVDTLKKSNKKIAIQGENNEYNRRVLETMPIHYITNVEYVKQSDTLKQKESGINHVLATIAQKKNITFVINLSKLKQLPKEKKVKAMSRILQNIKICRKARCKIAVVSFAKKHSEILTTKQQESFLYSVGASSQQVKKSLNI